MPLKRQVNNMDNYMIDLSIMPTTFDFFHVWLAGAVAVLAMTVIILLITLLITLIRANKKTVQPQIIKSEPEIKIVEKIVEVEKLVQAPPPPPIVLKEATPDAALQLLGLLQKEARFLDFIQENVAAFSDAEVGIAARVVHEGCSKVLKEHFSLDTVFHEPEGSKITLEQGFDATKVRLIGNIVSPPFTGRLIHKGWQVTQISLPKLTAEHDPKSIAPGEVEL
jgi:hypothetical protein